MRTMDPGFTTANVFTARIGFPAAYTDTVAEWRFFDQVRRARAALPGVQAGVDQLGAARRARQGFGGNNFAVEGQTLSQGQGLSERAIGCR